MIVNFCAEIHAKRMHGNEWGCRVSGLYLHNIVRRVLILLEQAALVVLVQA